MTEKEARLMLETVWACGCRYFDTAPLYGLGLSETRLNGFLRPKPRASYLISTKVGRLLELSPAKDRSQQGVFFETPSRRCRFDYSYDGIMRSLEASLERLGLDLIDIVYVDDVDAFTHDKDKANARIKEFMNGGYRALDEMRAAGAVKAVGAGVNQADIAQALARMGEFDLFMLSGRYTLLQQDAIENLLPFCAENAIGIVVASPFNSGILATGLTTDAHYNYGPAPDAVKERVRKIYLACKSFKIKLPEAALRFPLGHPSVLSVVAGPQRASEARRNATMMSAKIPPALWRELKAANLLHAKAPTPR